MGVWRFRSGGADAVELPLCCIRQLRLVFPAERLLHRSRGIDRTAPLPTRVYETPAGRWATDDTNLLRLLHNDFSFVVRNVASVPEDAEFAAVSTNYGNNPCYCIRRPCGEAAGGRMFYLEQENFDELKSGLSVVWRSEGLSMEAVRVRFNPAEASAIDSEGRILPDDALVLTAPAMIWEGRFVGWDRYASETYDCRNIVKIQYFYRTRAQDPAGFEAVRAEIQRIQRLWGSREAYVSEVLKAAAALGYAEYERMIVGVGSRGEHRYLLFAAVQGTVEGVVAQLTTRFSDLEAAFQINEGGGTGILIGSPSGSIVLGPSRYRRGRTICCLLAEMRPGC